MTAGNSIVMESLLDLDWHLCQHSSKDMQADDVRMFFIWQLEHGSAGLQHMRLEYTIVS